MFIKKVLNRKKDDLTILRGIWSMKVASCICEVRVNMYGILFRLDYHMLRAIENRPWLIMGNRW
ncbi:hypothetical protein CRYUN_Cryun37aG0005400 [Craigia yunnanensis]